MAKKEEIYWRMYWSLSACCLVKEVSELLWPTVQKISSLWGHFMPDAAAAAKSLQSCPTLCNPIDSSPPGFPVPGILQARTLEWVAISFSSA